MSFTHKEYEVINAAELPPDPAEVARADGWVGKGGRSARLAVGAWRWPLLHQPGLYEHIREWFADAESIIDFGGAAGPCGYGATVVDRQAECRSLDDVPGKVDLIFTSHTLEHVRDLGLILCSFQWKLRPGGRVVALVPSWRNTMLRAENWNHHAHTFYLATVENGVEDPAPEWVPLDTLFIRHGFTLRIAADGLNNILIGAERN